MELFHRQVTRQQGVFSIRFFHESFGLHFLAPNVASGTTVLDFPSEARFVEELCAGYDLVGISFIVANFLKIKRMAKLVRMCDTYLRGYRALATTPDPFLEARRDAIKRRALKFRLFLTAARDHAHNAHARELADRVTAEYRDAFGPMSLRELALSQVVRAYAAREAGCVASGRNVYQLRTVVTRYRM